jgi:hypothetical protein
MKDINKYRIFNDKIHIFYRDLTKDTVDYFSMHLDISFNSWDISNKKKLEFDKKYSRTHKNGWIISGKIVTEYISWVPFITAFHKKYGIIYGNFSEEIIVVSDNPDEALFHFLDNKFALQIYYGQVGIYNFFLNFFLFI